MFSLLLGVDRSGAAGARESMYLTPGAAGLARLPHVTRRAQASTSSASSPCFGISKLFAYSHAGGYVVIPYGSSNLYFLSA